MTVNSFFAGIGGFDLGFERMGFDILFQCEINDFCCQVLNRHWPNVPIANDIRNINIENIPDAEIWCGGFPCQDVSVARGSKGRAGLRGENSGLFYNFMNLVGKKKPKIILLENVTGLLNSHKGQDFKIVLESLTTLGYGVSWRVLNARYFGVPQSRPRVYMCAWLGSPENAAFALHEYSGSIKPDNPRKAFLKVSKNNELGVFVPQIAYCLAATSGRHTGTDWSRTYISYEDKVRRITPTEAEKLQGFPENWTLPTQRKEKNSDIDSHRYHAVGNAVSVPTVSWIANRIKTSLSVRNGYSPFQQALQKFKDFTSASATIYKFNDIKNLSEIKWSSGGIAYKDEIFQSIVHARPTHVTDNKLINVIDKYEVDEKYFLSPSAARGILRRVMSQNRVLFKPLYDALERLSVKPELEKEPQSK
jgi:DNA (cytosine-5)-methyltransferase 1